MTTAERPRNEQVAGTQTIARALNVLGEVRTPATTSG